MPDSGTLWFPASFGTEFKLSVLFFFRRQIMLSAENRDFEATHVTSKILEDGANSEEENPSQHP
jgi:hypothetical protein